MLTLTLHGTTMPDRTQAKMPPTSPQRQEKEKKHKGECNRIIGLSLKSPNSIQVLHKRRMETAHSLERNQRLAVSQDSEKVPHRNTYIVCVRQEQWGTTNWTSNKSLKGTSLPWPNGHSSSILRLRKKPHRNIDVVCVRQEQWGTTDCLYMQNKGLKKFVPHKGY